MTSKLQRLSRVFRPQTTFKSTSNSTVLMVKHGLLHTADGAGLFNITPVGQRALDKLIAIIAKEMDDIGGQKVTLTALGSKKLWDSAGRWDQIKKDMFTLKDRNDEQFCLQPTCEETVTKLISDQPVLPLSNFPLLLYQITNKYRDEMHPRFGLIRGREFLMKDLYSFHTSRECALETYQIVSDAYFKIFAEKLKLPVYRVRATSGLFGGNLSHEFHLENALGQDYIYVCQKCQSTGFNREVLDENRDEYPSTSSSPPPSSSSSTHKCGDCGDELQQIRTVELGHTFYLGDKYSTALKECLRLPEVIAPYRDGSKEDEVVTPFLLDVAHSLASYSDDVVLDDRTKLTVGRRLRDANAFGYPYIVTAARRTLQSMGDRPLFEVQRSLAHSDQPSDCGLLTHSELFRLLSSTCVTYEHVNM